MWTRRLIAQKVDAIALRLTNYDEWHERDFGRGIRDFRLGSNTAHRDAFDIFLCRVGWGILRIESMIADYLEAMSEAGKAKP